jgi:hypothetical protein
MERMEDKISFAEEDWVLLLIQYLIKVVHFLDFHLDSSLSSTFITVTTFELLSIIEQVIKTFVDEWAFVDSIAIIAQVKIADLEFIDFMLNFNQHLIYHSNYPTNLAGKMASFPS